MAMMASVAFGQGLVSQLSDGQPEAPKAVSSLQISFVYHNADDCLKRAASSSSSSGEQILTDIRSQTEMASSLLTTTRTVYSTAVVPATNSASTPQKSETCGGEKMHSSYPATPQPVATTPVAATNGVGAGAPPAGTPPVGTPPAGASGASSAGTPPAGAGGVPGGAPPASYPLGTAPGTSPAAASNGVSSASGTNSTVTVATPPAAATGVGSTYQSSASPKPSGAAGALEPGLGFAAAAAFMLGLM